VTNNATSATDLAESVKSANGRTSAPQLAATDAIPTETAAPTRSEPEQGRAWRWWLVAAIVVGYLVQIAWRMWLAKSASTPVAHGDEDRYLISARVLAGGPGGDGNDTAAFRRMGYPLLLAPIYQFTSNPFTVYHAAQALGAVVNALTFPLAYLFGRRVFRMERRWLALALAFVAATLPAVVYYGEFALTDVLFAPIGLGWLLLLHTWLTAGTRWARTLAAVGAGAVVGYAYVVHVRGAILLGVHVLVLIATAVARRNRWALAAASAGTAIVVSQLDWVTDRMVGNRLTHGGIEPQSRLWHNLTTGSGLAHTLCDTAGQLWYAGVGTWGLGAVGLIVAVARIRGRDVEEADRAQRVVLGVALAATVLIAFSSAAALPLDGRVSNHAYFRYIAFLAPVWVMLGALPLYRAGRRRALSLIGRSAALLGVGAFLVLSQVNELYKEWFHPFDTPEVSFMTYSWHTLRVAEATVVGLVLLGLLAVGLAATRWRRSVAVALGAVLLINVFALEVVNARSVRPMVAGEYGTGPQLVRDVKLRPGDVVAQDQWVPLGPTLNHQREVYWAAVPTFDHETADPPSDATVVIAAWHNKRHHDWDAAPGWTQVAGDPVNQWAVWLRDGDPRIGTISWPGH